MCPICALGVVATLGISRWLNIDDSAFGVWVGALILALSLWTFDWFFRKSAKKPQIVLLPILGLYLFLTVWPMQKFGFIPSECQTIWGVNRFYFGIGAGIIVAGLAILADKLIRLKNQSKVLFPYQRVALPLGLLLLASLILNQVCKTL